MLKYYGADPEFSLKGKTAIITGGAAGIGYATAEFFAKKGVNQMCIRDSACTAQPWRRGPVLPGFGGFGCTVRLPTWILPFPIFDYLRQ